MPSLASPEHRPANQSPHIGSNTGPGRLPFIPPPPPPPLPTSPPLPSVYPISPPLQSPQGHSAHPGTSQTFSSLSSPPSHTNTPTARPPVPLYPPARPLASVPPNATPPPPPLLSPLNQSFPGTPYTGRPSALARNETVEVPPLYFHPVSHPQQHPDQNNLPASRPSGLPPAGPPSRSSTVPNPPPLPFHILAPFSEPSYVQDNSSHMLWSQNNTTGIGDEEAPPAFRLANLRLNNSTEAESQHYESPPVWVPDLPPSSAASGYPTSNTSHPQGPAEDIWGQRVQASAPVRRETYKTLWSDESDTSPTTTGYTRQSPHQYIQDLAEPGNSSSNHTMRAWPGADAHAAVHSHGFRQPTPYNLNQIPQGPQHFARSANPARHPTYPDPSNR
ncbi:hypothetical protein AN958_04019 [Leucoagaricus sp. SymC.cos]|nr:hypothetical protein AN958_04019 [Leucoagaricus sp. SymC.cos]